MFKRETSNIVTCDFCGKTNCDLELSIECFSGWQRISIEGVDKNTDKLEYRVHNLLSDIKHLCPKCAELINDLMSRKHYWIKVIEK